MRRSTAVLLFGAMTWAQSITEVPQCAQNCLSNSTTMQTACQIVDLKCLCTNTVYVNTLSCCLATQCDTADQQKAIAFNQLECASVNETAPGFVGCSPISLSSLVLVGGSATAVTVAATSTASTVSTISTSMDMGGGSNKLLTTVIGSVESGLATFTASTPVTATYNAGNSLLTGSCTVPHFAIVTDYNGGETEYPEVGCSPERPDCCPFPYSERAVLTKCPSDYFTTAGGCCPTGYQIYFTALGIETPCYTIPIVTHMPGSTPTVSGLTLITEHVFTKMYELGVSHKEPAKLPLGGLIGIIVNILLFIAIIMAVVFCVRRRRKRKAEPIIPRNREMSEPTLNTTPFELASPQGQPTSPGSTRSDGPMGHASLPPAYEDAQSRPVSIKPSQLQELPGSTYIYEHHPAFTVHGTVEPASATTIVSSPPFAPTILPRSPGRSPVTSPRTPAAGMENSPVISPMSSPRQI